MKIIRYNDIFGLRGRIKMSTNPPKEIVDAGFRIIFDGKVFHWPGIGWVEEREATAQDEEKIPLVRTPHCSQCEHYDVLKDKSMYCFKSHKRITARKRPCKNYSEK